MLKQRVTKLGSNTNNALKTGVTYWNLNNASDNQNQNISSHLTLPSCLFSQKSIEPCLLAKHKTEPHRCW